MIQDLIQYPDERINIASVDVRFFDDELSELIDDMKDTIVQHNARGLTAIQISIPLSVVVVLKPEGEWLELINPRIFKTKDKTIHKEKTLYIPDIEEEIPRYEYVSIIYQDRQGVQHSVEAEGEFGYMLQRKIDYIFGGTFANKLDKKSRKRVEHKLSINGANGEFNANTQMSKREYFKSVISKLLFFEALALTAPLFDASNETRESLYHYGLFATIASLILIVGYLIYAKYEASRIISCTGCQIVSFTAVAVKYFLITTVLFLGSYFLLKPI